MEERKEREEKGKEGMPGSSMSDDVLSFYVACTPCVYGRMIAWAPSRRRAPYSRALDIRPNHTQLVHAHIHILPNIITFVFLILLIILVTSILLNTEIFHFTS